MRTLHKRLALVIALAMVLSLGAVPALAAPEASVAETVLVDSDAASITLTGYDPNGDYGPEFELLLENKSDKALYFNVEETAVNGVMCSSFCGETVPAGQKVYTELYWWQEDLQEVGINYIQSVTASIDIWDDETYDDVYLGMTSWEVTVGETDVPAVEPVSFEGMEPVEVFSGDTVMRVVGFSATGGYDDGPAVYIYLENNTDRTVYFTADDVAVNGFGCDPFWGETVLPGSIAYDIMDWWSDDLEESHIETVETVQFSARAVDDDDWTEYNSGSASLDVTGAAPAAPAAPAEEPAAEEPAAEEPAADVDAEVAALMGAVNGNVYTNDYFGLTFTPPEDWTFSTQEELLAQYDLAADRFEGTEMGDDIKQFMDSESGFSVMMAVKEGSLQNVNALVESLPGLGKYLTESQLLDLVEQDLGLEEGGDMSAIGLEGATLSRNTFTFAGQEHEAFRVEYTDTSMGIELPMYMQMVFLMGEDYVLQLTITTVFEDQTAEVGAMFTIAE